MMIQEYLKKKPLIFDGAMGTYLEYKNVVPEEGRCEMINLINPAVVQEIHEEYLNAGAAAIKTNTFAANSRMLGEDMAVVSDVIKKGYMIAKSAADKFEERFVFADIGPVPLEEDQKAFDAYRELVDIFLSCGAVCFLFETMESLDGLEEIAAYIKKKRENAFVMVSFGASPEGYTRGGFLVRKLFLQLQQCANIDAVGFNCISGPKHLLEQVKGLEKGKIKKYLTIMPNAGYPTMLGNRIHYSVSRDYFGKIARELLENGTAIVGGCCGTTPGDIESIVRYVDTAFVEKLLIKRREEELKNNAGDSAEAAQDVCSGTEFAEQEEKDGISALKQLGEKNAFAKKLAAGEKVIVVELDPPVEPDIDFFMEGAARYQCAGVDAIDIADCPIAKARIDSSILACKLTRELGMTAIPHMTCRDRNINATKALLLGLNIEGVNNVLTVTGDPVPAAMRNQIKTVFSYNSAVLARNIQSFNHEVFVENPFMVSGAININALNFESQIIHAKKKIENGVSVLFTQPVLSKRGLENLRLAKKELPVKILGGIMPVVSYRNAAFMSNEMAGIEIEEEIIHLYKDKNREEGETLAYEISKKIIDEISDIVDGYYVITPFKRVELILKIVEYIKK